MRSWYGSWPRTPKSSASTQLARETILGGTTKPSQSPDLRRFDTRREVPVCASSVVADMSPQAGAETAALVAVEVKDSLARTELAGDPTTTAVAAEVEGTLGIVSQPEPQLDSGWWVGWLGKTQEGDKPTSSSEYPATESFQPSVQKSSAPLDEGRVAALREGEETAALSALWFPFWHRPSLIAGDQLSDNATATSAMASPPQEPRETPSEDAAPALEAVPSGSTWAFWFRDSGRSSTADPRSSPERGQLAVIGEPSESHPRPSTDALVAKHASPAATPAKRDDLAAVSPILETSSRKKRLRPQSVDLPSPLPSSPGPAAPHICRPTKDASLPENLTGYPETPANLLLPSFRGTYQMATNPSIIRQIGQLLLRTQNPPPRHLALTSGRWRIRKAVVIGVHGLFPAPYLRSLIGQPTGTSSMSPKTTFSFNLIRDVRSEWHGDVHLPPVPLLSACGIGADLRRRS